MSRLTIVVGGQAGSEGKGAVCGALQREQHYDYAVRMGGPNAGHTIYDDKGRRFALRQIPVAAVADPHCQLVIAAGSEVDLDVLYGEIEELEAAGHEVGPRLIIDKSATVISPRHKRAEEEIQSGTTGKGIGGARADRAMRGAGLVADLPAMEFHSVDTQALLREVLDEGFRVMLEGTQGYWLGSHAGYYPYCTSGDCRAIDFMAACGIPPMEAEVWVVLRTHPIRIAGNSGPLEDETTWEEIGVEPEITTVTKKVRRVGKWNESWARLAVEANRVNGGPKIALTFADYWWPEVADSESAIHWGNGVFATIEKVEQQLDATIAMVGTGPRTQVFLEGAD